MNCIYKEFKGKEELHVVLSPMDLDCLFTILKSNRNALAKIFPWDSEKGAQDYIKVTDWFNEKTKKCLGEGAVKRSIEDIDAEIEKLQLERKKIK